MKINLYDVLSVEGSEKSYDASFEGGQVNFQGEQLEVMGVAPFKVTVISADKELAGIHLELNVRVRQACGRCLEPVTRDYALSIDRTVDVARKVALTDKNDEFDEISYIEDSMLDVDLLILDELYTVLPMTVLCKEDCKGICKVCGTNLNKKSCDCDQTVPDPRMAVFGDVFKEFKEV